MPESRTPMSEARDTALLLMVLALAVDAVYLGFFARSPWWSLACVASGLAVETRRMRHNGWRRERLVLDALRAHPEGLYGLDLWKLTKIGPGVLYPMLARLEQRGDVRSWWGRTPPDGGPRRRCYGLAATPQTGGED